MCNFLKKHRVRPTDIVLHGVLNSQGEVLAVSDCPVKGSEKVRSRFQDCEDKQNHAMFKCDFGTGAVTAEILESPEDFPKFNATPHHSGNLCTFFADVVKGHKTLQEVGVPVLV